MLYRMRKKLIGVAMILLFAVSTFAYGVWQENQSLRAELSSAHRATQEISQRIEGLEKELLAKEEALEQAKIEDSEIAVVLARLLGNEKYSNFTFHQIESVTEIVENTPLQLDAASALVYYADMYNLDYALILSIIETESNFQQYLVGSSNDRGFMQIIPVTEIHLTNLFGEKLGLEYNPDRIFEPDYNLGLGISYIAYLRDRHEGDIDKMLTEYNKGAGGLTAYYSKYATYSSQYSRSVINRSYKYDFFDTDCETNYEATEDCEPSNEEK